MSEPLLVERDDRGVVTVTLDRPDVRNAFDAALIRSIRETFEGFAADADARVIVLTGAGSVFSAGADLNWMRGMAGADFDENLADSRYFEGMLRAVHDCPRPVVARVNGHALGGGTGLISCADVAVAVRSALFAFSEVRLGIAPAVISPYVLPRIGLGNARRLFLTGERFEAADGQRYGLVHLAVAPDELDATVGRIVDDLLAAGPDAQAEIKTLLRRVVAASDLDEAADVTVETIARLRVSDEGQEGMRAFFEKRPPAWVPTE